ncbi:hypothetical protein DID88_003233 [Monilinia fructigena]|uniref:t-SNARE coiled-coil homology domain-containing protein n=1 Tax=Monilinia fructigena TaxID=38457 RepID=A0A395IUR0_9HELO|nr:hypothetical protein DID88_003233 [Monilinia fructigena]
MSYTQQYQGVGGNPYENSGAAEAGYGGNHLAQPGLSHEMPNYSHTSNYSSGTPGAIPPPSNNVLTQQQFLDRVDYAKSEIRSLSSNISQIATLHQRALSSPDSSSTASLEALVTETQLKNTKIHGTKNVKSTQAKRLKTEFENQLQQYREEELNYRNEYRRQIGRQYRIVNPEATEAEVEEASQMDWGSEGVFQTALKSNRSGQASSVLGAVRARHNELQRIEATLTDLASMFADMAQIVEAQDPVVEHTEQNAIKTAEDVDRGNTEIDKANEHARHRNRLKWWCFLVTILIILAIALGVGLGVGLAVKNKK